MTPSASPHGRQSETKAAPTIRRAEPGDAAALAALVRGFRDHLRTRAPTDAELERALERARARGARRFRLHTNDGNSAAHALYPGGRELVFAKDLPGGG